MTKPQCDGSEEHGHYKLDTGETFYHSHEHTVMSSEFNRLHHHAPLDHANFTEEELTRNSYTVKTPF